MSLRRSLPTHSPSDVWEQENSLPSIDLVEAIAVAKVKAVEESIEISHRLQVYVY